MDEIFVVLNGFNDNNDGFKLLDGIFVQSVLWWTCFPLVGYIFEKGNFMVITIK